MENAHWETVPDEQKHDWCNISDDDIYNKLVDCRISGKGVIQARQLQTLANEFTFPEDKVYSSPHRRTLETLCHMLDTHP